MTDEALNAPVSPLRTSESIAALAAALAKAQAAIVAPKKDREVTVKTKAGGTYKFEYATLDAITDAIRAPLTANGLWFIQALGESAAKYRLVTRLLHSSGEWIESETPLVVQAGDNPNQQFGAALTYMRRYALSALLGIVADEDTDGNASDYSTRNRAAPLPPLTPASEAAADRAAAKFARTGQMPDPESGEIESAFNRISALIKAAETEAMIHAALKGPDPVLIKNHAPDRMKALQGQAKLRKDYLETEARRKAPVAEAVPDDDPFPGDLTETTF